MNFFCCVIRLTPFAERLAFHRPELPYKSFDRENALSGIPLPDISNPVISDNFHRYTLAPVISENISREDFRPSLATSSQAVNFLFHGISPF